MYQEFLSNGKPEATLYSVATSDGDLSPGIRSSVLRQMAWNPCYMHSAR